MRPCALPDVERLEEMSEKIACTACGALTLVSTAEANGGLCIPYYACAVRGFGEIGKPRISLGTQVYARARLQRRSRVPSGALMRPATGLSFAIDPAIST